MQQKSNNTFFHKFIKKTLIKIFYDRIGDKRYLAFDLLIYPKIF
jgi:hypothetical protein